MTWRNFTQHVRNLTYQDILQADLLSLINIIITQQTTNSHSWTTSSEDGTFIYGLWNHYTPNSTSKTFNDMPITSTITLKKFKNKITNCREATKRQWKASHQAPPYPQTRKTPLLPTHPHTNLTTGKGSTHFRTTTMLPAQFLHFMTPQTTTTTTTQSTIETKHCWRTVHFHKYHYTCQC